MSMLRDIFQNIKSDPRSAMGGGGYGPMGMAVQSLMQRGQQPQGGQMPFMGPLSGMFRPQGPQSMPGQVPRSIGIMGFPQGQPMQPQSMPGANVMGQPMQPQGAGRLANRPSWMQGMQMGGMRPQRPMMPRFPMGFGGR